MMRIMNTTNSCKNSCKNSCINSRIRVRGHSRQWMHNNYVCLCFLILIILERNDCVVMGGSSTGGGGGSSGGKWSGSLGVEDGGWRRRDGGGRSGVVEVLEVEVYNEDSGSWMGSPKGRWLKSLQTEEASMPPNELQPSDGTRFDSEWKIDVTGSHRDSLGWEYPSNHLRTRRWLRTTITATPTTTTSRTATTTSSSSSRSIAAMIRNNWNFKGFGAGFSKSLLHLPVTSFVIRMPLTMNLDWLERRPYIPTLTTSATWTYPSNMRSYNINASIPMELLKWILWTTLDYILFIIQLLYAFIIQSPLLFIKSTLLLLLQNNNNKNKRNMLLELPNLPIKRPFVTSLDITERLGVTFGWRFSHKYGWEYKITPWHCYLPNIPSLLRQTTTSNLGLFIAAPTTEPPYYSPNLMLSIAGIYLAHLLPSNQQSHPRNTNTNTNSNTNTNNDQNEQITETKTIRIDSNTSSTFSDKNNTHYENINNDSTRIGS